VDETGESTRRRFETHGTSSVVESHEGILGERSFVGIVGHEVRVDTDRLTIRVSGLDLEHRDLWCSSECTPPVKAEVAVQIRQSARHPKGDEEVDSSVVERAPEKREVTIDAGLDTSKSPTDSHELCGRLFVS